MITYVVTDLFQSPAKVLVNTVNTVGVMGKGIALEFKRYYPEMFQQYQGFCERGLFDIGQLWLYKTPHKWILNFPTKRHWRHKSKPEYIEAGLQKFAAIYDQKGITSISFPMLGCGNGELDWETQVRPSMEKYLGDLPINIYIHLYAKEDFLTPEHRNADAIAAWLRSEPQALAFAEFWQDLKTLLARQSTFENLTTGQKFDVALSLDDQTLSFKIAEEDRISVAKDTWINLWQYIRSAGFVRAQYLPFGMSQHGMWVVSLLAHLEYLQAIRLSSPHHREYEIGLQLIPQTDETRFGLFASQPHVVELA